MENLVIKDALISRNYTKGKGREIRWLVIHYFGVLAGAKQVAEGFAAPGREASAHYCVDEGNVVWRCVADEDIAWHCGTRGTYLHPECRNSNSIGIEVMPRKLDPTTAHSAAERDWYFSKQAEDNLLELVKWLMERYNIPPERVVRHYDVTGKWCPRPWVGEDVNAVTGTTGEEEWRRFRARLIRSEEVGEVRYERLKDIPEDSGFRAAVDALMTAGIIKGDGSDKGGNDDVIDLSRDMVRLLIFLLRAGVFDRALEKAGADGGSLR